MTDDKRLEALKVKAEELDLLLDMHDPSCYGLTLWINDDDTCGPELLFDPDSEADLDAATTLLAALDLDAVRVIDFIEAEPEFPDEMPDELLKTFQETVGCLISKESAELICRVIVQVTKHVMIKRLGLPREGYEWVLVERKVR